MRCWSFIVEFRASLASFVFRAASADQLMPVKSAEFWSDDVWEGYSYMLICLREMVVRRDCSGTAVSSS